MITRLRRSVFLGIILLLSGCLSELAVVDMPLELSPPAGTRLDSASGKKLEGIYTVEKGSETFTNSLIGKWVGDRFCLYSGSEVIFTETAVAVNNDTGYFSGYYRFVRSARIGTLNLHALPNEGGAGLLVAFTDEAITLRGVYTDGSRVHEVVLKRVKPLPNTNQKFYIMGNCAGGRNSERLGRSENSIEMAHFSQYLGCNGIEIDLHTTKDGEIILFHDDSFSPRTVQSTYLLGDINQFTLSQIQRHGRLIHGEKIVTLQEFLNYVIDSTSLELVWLDPKVLTGMDRALQVQREALDHAKAKNRTDFTIVFGITSNEMLSTYQQCSNRNTTPILCELSPDIVWSLDGCVVWAPRWTNGLQLDLVKQMRAEGYMVFPWTIDSPEYMQQFLEPNVFDGILSNYPSMLTGLYFNSTK